MNMKKIGIMLIASLLLLCSCNNKAMENAGDRPADKKEDTTEKTDEVTKYDVDGVSFDIPEMWRKNFKAVTRDAGSNGNTYPQTDFYYTANGRDIRLMSIGKYTREQWDALNERAKTASDALLGESGDKKHVYSIFFENHDYITEKELRETLGKIKSEAEKIRDKITIK